MMNIHKLKALLSGVAMVAALTSTALNADTQYYPAHSTAPLAVGSEEFQENYASLAGLEGVHVVTKFVVDSAKKYKLDDMKSDLVPQIRTRLEKAGLRMLTENEVKTTPGQPTLTFYPAYAGADIDIIKAGSGKDENVTASPAIDPAHDCCRSSIWASFQQSSSILRAPNSQFQFATWGTGDDDNQCENRGAWTYNAVLETIDEFVADYTKAEIESKPKLVTMASDVPDNCAQAWLMNLTVFETNETSISDAVKPILDQLADTANRCSKFSYLIETHADKRADAAYNKLLSEARGHAIKDYLMRKNIAYDRLTTIAFGESKLLSNGETEQDHAVNRRVVIIPQRNQG